MMALFYRTEFNQNLESWKPYQADINDMFIKCPTPIPYWAQFENIVQREKSIYVFDMKKLLQIDLQDKTLAKNKYIFKL